MARAPNCVMCYSFCTPNMEFTIPRCEGMHNSKKGGLHFVCRTCHDHVLRRINTAMAECPGCSNGSPYFATASHPATVVDVTGDDQDVMMAE